MKITPALRVSVNVRGLVMACGGRRALFLRFKKYGLNTPCGTIDHWLQRGRIPAKRLIEILMIAQCEGKSLMLTNFIKLTFSIKCRTGAGESGKNHVRRSLLKNREGRSQAGAPLTPTR